MTDRSDEELMNLYKKGDYKAFEELYRRYSRKVYGFLKKRIETTQICEEIFQKTFSKVHQKRSLYNDKYLFSAWLFTICRNTLIDHYRQRDEALHIELDEDLAVVMNTAEDKILLEELLSQIPEKYRISLQQRYLEGLDFSEIAKSLNVSEINVRKIVSRGLKSLKILGS